MKNTLAAFESTIMKMVEKDPFRALDEHPTRLIPLQGILAERCYVLNKMFRPTPENIQRFIQVNNHLYTLSQKLRNRVKQMETQRPLISDPNFDDDYELEGHLTIPFNGPESVLSLPDDSYYGSNFALMIECLDAAYHYPILDVTPQKESLDDGTSWDEGPFQLYPEFKNITICYAIHEICDHRPYSIPDLLRLNNFCCETTFTAQSITTQDGSRP